MIPQRPGWARTKINDRWARLTGVPAIALLVLVIGDQRVTEMGAIDLAGSFLRDLCYTGFYWETARLIFLYVHHRFPHVHETSRRVFVQLSLFVLLISAGGLFIASISVYFFNNVEHENFTHEFFDIAGKSLLLLGPIMLLYECAHLFALYQTKLYEAERFKKEAVTAQFELLKSQVDPHFLFNSLNTLISLIPDEPQRSVEFVQRLSNVYRGVLSFNEEKLVDLDRELHFLKDYIFLFQIRFGQNLVVKFECGDEADGQLIVPFTLQLLVENAIKHNIISRQRPLTIQVLIGRDAVQVINNLQQKTSGVISTQTGLSNIVNRYQLVSSHQVSIENTGTEFKVTVPLLKKRPL